MMGSPPSELKPLLLRPFGDQSDDHQKLQELVARLEEERLKIDAFKRELPLCMQLLTNAMEASRQQLQSYKELGARPRPPPVLEEFIPLKNKSSSSHNNDDDDDVINNVGEKDMIKKPNMASDNKANWMTSAQLWSHHHHHHHQANNNKNNIEGSRQLDVVVYNSPKEEEEDDDDDSIGFSMMTPKAAVSTDNNGRGGGAFLTFPNPTTLALGAALSERDKKGDDQADNVDALSCISQRDGQTAAAATVANNNNNNNSNSSSTTATQTQRKARRCWSPDLHRRFVNALHILGGPQEIQTSHEEANSEPTNGSLGSTAAGRFRRNMGPVRVRSGGHAQWRATLSGRRLPVRGPPDRPRTTTTPLLSRPRPAGAASRTLRAAAPGGGGAPPVAPTTTTGPPPPVARVQTAFLCPNGSELPRVRLPFGEHRGREVVGERRQLER